MSAIDLAFFGDDFTGSTDALESLELGGVPSVLFLRPPTPSDLAEFDGVRAVGLAGMTRAATPTQMSAELPARLASLRDLGARLIHYKVCSTFDSSPEVGSIGRAIEIGAEVVGARLVPVVVGTPPLGRFVVFGNLFARSGQTTHRIDRHPTMSRHPITPMGEADLRIHLGRQTERSIGLVDITTIAHGVGAIVEAIDDLIDQGRRVIVFDTVSDRDLDTIGQVMVEAARQGPLFVVGSSAVERAVASWLHSKAEAEAWDARPPATPVKQILVMSGSASPVTADQISWSEQRGFVTIRLEPLELLERSDAVEHLAAEGSRAWERGASVVFFSAKGPDDPSFTAARAVDSGQARRALVDVQARLLRRMIETTDVQRMCISGGDTCGHAARGLGVDALTMRAVLDPGAPLCTTHSGLERFDGLDVAFKGGQVGTTEYFGKVLAGGP